MEALETITQGNLTLTLHHDECADESPLEWSNGAAIFATFEDRIQISEYHNFECPENAQEFAKDNGWQIFPLYKYEHGGVAYSIGPFGCPWDSGQVGYILINPNECPQPEKYATGVCEEFSQWCNGEVYGYVIEGKDGDHLDSCWGFYGYDYALNEGESALVWQIDHQRKSRQDRLKELIRNRVPLMQRELELANI